MNFDEERLYRPCRLFDLIVFSCTQNRQAFQATAGIHLTKS